MGRRREPETLTDERMRQEMLRNIRDPAAIYLYDQAMSALAGRGHADFMSALLVRDACQWTEAINGMQEELRTLVSSGEAEERRVASIIKNKQAAEDARRSILDGLMLTPQKKRGRPKEERPAREDEESTAADDAWAAFDGEAFAGDGGAS